MNLFRKRPPAASAAADFDLLRARLEAEVSTPAVIAIASPTARDGRELATRALADSLAMAGYSTLIIDAAIARDHRGAQSHGLSIEEIANRLNPGMAAGAPTVLLLDDGVFQQRTSQSNLQSALSILRSKFDYVVVSGDAGLSTSFTASVMQAADAVLVSIRSGRNQKSADMRLSEELDRLGSRFLGVIELAPASVTDRGVRNLAGNVRRRSSVYVEREYEFREPAESPT